MVKVRAVISILVLSVCIALSAQQKRSQTDSARVYVYMRDDVAARTWRPVYCDGSLIAEVKRGKFFVVTLASGKHTLSGKDGIPAFVDVRAGQDYFVRFERSVIVSPSGSSEIWGLTAIRAEDAKKELNYLGYIDDEKVHAPSVSAKDPTVVAAPKLKSRSEAK